MAELLLESGAQEHIALTLWNTGIFGVKPGDELVKLKSGRMSPHYGDLRKGYGNYETKNRLVGALHRTVGLYVSKQVNTDQAPRRISDVFGAVIGIPEAMTGYASSVGDRLHLPTPALRADFSGSGNKSPVLGDYEEGVNVAVLDDVITQGEEKIIAVERMRALGMNPVAIFVILDREEGGIPIVEAETGVPVYPVIGVSSLMNLTRASGEATETEYARVYEYLTQYGEPHAQAAMGIAA